MFFLVFLGRAKVNQKISGIAFVHIFAYGVGTDMDCIFYIVEFFDKVIFGDFRFFLIGQYKVCSETADNSTDDCKDNYRENNI